MDEPALVTDEVGDGYQLHAPMATAGGGLVLLYQRVDQATVDILVTVCEQITCSDAVSAGLHQLEQAGVPHLSGALGPDGLLRVVWSTTDGFVLVSCDDAACSAFLTSWLVPLEWKWSHQIGIVVAGDGATVVAAADFGPLDEQVIPGVWFFRCEGRQCAPA